MPQLLSTNTSVMGRLDEMRKAQISQKVSKKLEIVIQAWRAEKNSSRKYEQQTIANLTLAGKVIN